MSLSSKFKTYLIELASLNSALSVLDWDQQTFMPQRGSEGRALASSALAGIIHEKFTSKEFGKLLEDAKKMKLSKSESIILSEVLREYEREKKLPSEFVKELSKITSEAHQVWARARTKNDFKMFLPYLKKIIALKRREAELVGYKNSPYEALLDTYEPYTSLEEITKALGNLRDFLVPFLAQIKKSKVKVNPKILDGEFPEDKQKEFVEYVAKLLGFDFDSGRLDPSIHPFTTNFHPQDVRITTRYDKNNIFYALGSTIHEVGHALYEQGLPAENFGSPLGESVSLGIHESQSRMWENMVGNSKHFWKFLYPKLQKQFPKPFAKVSFGDFYKAINNVQPSLIRTESDEVTYNLHIIIRFEIEKDLIEGKIKPEDLPKIWNQKYKQYLGVKVPNDSKGVLQDVHWSSGLFGYFPTYSLGNIYAGQLYNAVKRELPELEKQIAKGDLKKLKDWCQKNIYMHGKYYKASELMKNVTGEGLNTKHIIEYLKQKYGKIYSLN